METQIRFARAFLYSALLVAAGCSGSNDSGPPAPSPPPAPPPVTVPFTITDLVEGNGAAASNGQLLTVDYTGWLYDASLPDNKGRQFDSTAAVGPFQFRLGTGQVIAGWDQGLVGMRVGGTRRLVIPPALAYGEQGAGGGVIPPNATLIFDIQLRTIAD